MIIKKKGKKLWRQEITPFILTVEPRVAANALWGQRQLTTSVEIQWSHVKTRNLNLSCLKNLRLYEKNLAQCWLSTLNTWAIHVQTPNGLWCRVVLLELLERHQNDRILQACTIYPQGHKGLNLKVLPVPTDPHLRPGYLERYYQLNSIYCMIISLGDEGQVKLKGSLKQLLNDQSPQCTLRLNQVAFKILHPQRQQLYPLYIHVKPWDSEALFL